jgi:hypothetical protein
MRVLSTCDSRGDVEPLVRLEARLRDSAWRCGRARRRTTSLRLPAGVGVPLVPVGSRCDRW